MTRHESQTPRWPAGGIFERGGYGVNMVSMYVDIRQAAELLAKVTGTHPTHQAQQISLAGQFHGLEFRGPGQTLWQWRPGIFTTATGDDGKVYVRPAGAYKGERRKTLQAIRGEAETDELADNELVTPYFKVSLADIVRNPFFRFDAEIQEQILEAHKAAAVALLPAEDATSDMPKPLGTKLAQERAILATLERLGQAQCRFAWNLTLSTCAW